MSIKTGPAHDRVEAVQLSIEPTSWYFPRQIATNGGTVGVGV